ncbi:MULTISPECIES: hypothetical protein [unclassified Ensifer]|uniref:hypothetical protein n=1 Tax=unclassified Ensifer TaxID=2633371 RepID=UPI000813C85A|nr:MULTISPECIES: hypothetical protein [unclassified Ensifer]OCP23589.1 hypothetical protein BC363_24470 [Ensifer sp. LC384]OCP24276.1 hypothetical protein BC361_20950 [Ensifer sp. LC54]
MNESPKIRIPETVWKDICDGLKNACDAHYDQLLPHLETVRSQIEAAVEIVVGTDVDKTLTLPATSSEPVLQPTIAASLTRLIKAKGHVLVASAREYTLLDNLFGLIEGINLAANEGCVTLINGQKTNVVRKPDYSAPSKVAVDFANDAGPPVVFQIMGHFLGVFINKTHPRYQEIYDLLAPFAKNGVAIEDHTIGVTLEPADKPGKWRALVDFLNHLADRRTFVLFFGDDKNDIAAQQGVKDMGGLSFKVVPPGESMTIPNYVNGLLFGTHQTAAFLEAVAQLAVAWSTALDAARG